MAELIDFKVKKGLIVSTTATINGTTQASSTTTGALIVAGGAGIGKNLYVGGTIYGIATTASTINTVQQTNSNTHYLTFVDSNNASATAESLYTTSSFTINPNNGSVKLYGTLQSTSTVSENSLYVQSGVGIEGSLYVKGPAYFDNSVVFSGTSTYVYSTNTIYTDNLINLHVPPGSTGTNHSWSVNDGQDIGFVFHYYLGGDRDAALVLANDSGYLEWYNDGAENLTNGTFTGTSYGVFKTGSIQLVHTTASNSTTTGALTVAGGVGVGQDLYVGGTIYGTINGTLVGNADTVSTVQRTNSGNHYLTFVDSNNASATAESVYTTSSVYAIPSSGQLWATQLRQTSDKVAIGSAAGQTSQSAQAVAIGSNAGNVTQGSNSVAIGSNAGNRTQGANSVAIGYTAGYRTQGVNSVAIGNAAAYNTQSSQAVAIGYQSGEQNQQSGAVSVGASAGSNTQGSYAVAIGNNAGNTSQTSYAISIGYLAGQLTQGSSAVAVGYQAGRTTQGNATVAVGHNAGQNTQTSGAVAIGYGSGNTNQGQNAIAIGYLAGFNSQTTGSIILNASGSTQDAGNAGFYVNPIRADATSSATSTLVYYNPTSRELTTASAASISVGSAGQVNTVEQTNSNTHYLTFVDSNNTTTTAESVYTTSSFVIVPSTGRIGIGTDSPQFKVHISNSVGNDASYTGGLLIENTGSPAGESVVAFKNIDTGANYWFVGVNQDSNLAFTYGSTFQDANTKMNLGSDGNLIIGGSDASFTTGSGIEIQRSGTATLRLDSGTFATELYGYTGGTGLVQLSAGYLDLGTNNLTRLRIYSNGNISVNTTTDSGYAFEVNGSFAAITKSFVINHPTKPGMKLRYGSLEGPENGVYVRGKLNGSNQIELPEYWTKLVDPESITVNLTPIGRHQNLYVEEIINNTVIVKNSNLINKEIHCYYTVYAERIDVTKLQVEI